MNILSAKACVWKLKIETPLAPNLSKTGTSFLYLQAKLIIFLWSHKHFIEKDLQIEFLHSFAIRLLSTP